MSALKLSIEHAILKGETGLPGNVCAIKSKSYFGGFSSGGEILFESIRDERQFKALTGVSYEEFMIILPVFSECYVKPAWEEYERGERKRRPGGGRKGRMPDMKNKLFFILYYIKNYDKFDVIGHKFDLDKSSACKNVHKLTKVLLSALAELNVLPKRAFSSPEELKEAFKNIKNLFIDAAERPCFRSADYETQKKFYSGKQGEHTLKNTVISSVCKYVLFLGYTVPGSIHDYGLFKTEFPPAEDWFKDFNLFMDLGFLGAQKDYSSANINIPHKKPRKSKKNPNPRLTEAQKEDNKKLSRIRVVAENAIGGMKRFSALTEEFRNKSIEFADDIAILAAGLWNLKLSVK